MGVGGWVEVGAWMVMGVSRCMDGWVGGSRCMDGYGCE